MNIKSSLLADRSKANCERILRYLESHPPAIQEFMNCLLLPDYELNQKAAWVLHFITDHRPETVDGWQKDLLEKCLSEGNHDAVTRAIVRHWGDFGYPESIEGEVYDLCFRYLQGNVSIAIKAHAMYACLRLVLKFPELRNEFQTVIQNILDTQGADSPGLKSRASNVLQKLNTIMK